eukprot:CAMPEP_0172573356 /NCGR_PEP_ID=MMETSP1067-20121228/136149_1 /TAXON_ID=265564 ORGANISM="Thalassiosira punctigera, Strain Tpunct2005C2" /NCGR_SAMPLE_ID=MMETSP1067 /ASSEMBLY_ACC=CAM_ASM_000444 /LENGTH=346 /DNA_ID=CAMNT_0013365959 /DNA_START=27 /DNA_END=1067 /DNA_ORIENTATION=+
MNENEKRAPLKSGRIVKALVVVAVVSYSLHSILTDSAAVDGFFDSGAGAEEEAAARHLLADPPKIRFEPPKFERFFPFNAVPESEGRCVTRQEILGISQGVRKLLEGNIRVLPRNGFLLGIVRHGGLLPNEHVDVDMGVVYTDLEPWIDKVGPKRTFHAAGFAFKLKPTEDYWVNWNGRDPIKKTLYPFLGVNIHRGDVNMHTNSIYPYHNGTFFYPFLSVKGLNHDAISMDKIRYNRKGGDLRIVNYDARVNQNNYKEGVQMGNVFDTKLDCFTEKQFYFTTIPVPCDYDVILTSTYGSNWNHVENRGELGQVEEGKETRFAAQAVSDKENENLLWGGPRPVCMP